jgi:hypothetical protein
VIGLDVVVLVLFLGLFGNTGSGATGTKRGLIFKSWGPNPELRVVSFFNLLHLLPSVKITVLHQLTITSMENLCFSRNFEPETWGKIRVSNIWSRNSRIRNSRVTLKFEMLRGENLILNLISAPLRLRNFKNFFFFWKLEEFLKQ